MMIADENRQAVRSEVGDVELKLLGGRNRLLAANTASRLNS